MPNADFWAGVLMGSIWGGGLLSAIVVIVYRWFEGENK